MATSVIAEKVGCQETWKNGVASQHVENGVKGTRVIIWSVANS